jgi:hypothetical protein
MFCLAGLGFGSEPAKQSVSFYLRKYPISFSFQKCCFFHLLNNVYNKDKTLGLNM